MKKYSFKIIIYVVCLVSFGLLSSACISIYCQDVRQGNYVTQRKIDKLTVGLTKEEVEKIMGAPALVPVLDVDRWDYYYSFHSRKRKINKVKSLSLYFIANKLKYYTGDWRPAQLPHKK